MADELQLEEADIEQFVLTRIRREDRDINGYISDLIAFLRRQLYRELRQAGPLESLRSRQALRFLGGLESIVDDGDLQSRIDTLRDLFDLQLSMARQEFQTTTGLSRAPVLSQEAKQFAAIFVGTRTEQVSQQIRSALGRVREGLVNRIISQDSQGLSDAEIIDEAMERIAPAIAGELKTAVAGFNRFVRQEQMKEAGLQYLLYAGPKDERNRLFCAIRARNIYTLDAVNAWDNGQGLPANIYCGGYNCRHELVPLSNELAQKLITERRLPGVNYYDYSHEGSGRGPRL